MLRNNVLELLAELKLSGMLAAYEEVISTTPSGSMNPEQVVFDLLQAESADRRLRGIRSV